MRYKRKLFYSLLIFFISVLIFPVYVYATGAFTLFDKPVVDIINDLIKLILSYAGRISLLVLILGGVIYIVSGSNPQRQESAKKTITYALLGLIFILLSYAFLGLLDRIFVQ